MSAVENIEIQTDKILKESKYYNQESNEFNLDLFISDCVTSGMFGETENV